MLNELIGKWKVIGCQLHGEWLPYSIFKEFIYSFSNDDKFRLKWGELSWPHYVGGFPKSKSGKVHINTSVTPHQIDMSPDEGEYSGKDLKGISNLTTMS